MSTPAKIGLVCVALVLSSCGPSLSTMAADCKRFYPHPPLREDATDDELLFAMRQEHLQSICIDQAVAR